MSNFDYLFAAMAAATLVVAVLLALRVYRTDSTVDTPLNVEFRRAVQAGAALLSLVVLLGALIVARTIDASSTLMNERAEQVLTISRTAARDADRSRKLLDQSLELQSEELTQFLLALPRYAHPKRLARYEAKIYSQAGEDGTLHEIFRRIGITNRFFVEFGSSSGQENNTVFLLRSGWKGLWIDGDAKAIAEARRNFAPDIAAGRLTVLEAFITAENIEELFRQANVPSEFDLISIDLDRNDYWVWRKIEQYRPRVAVVEYNAMFPPGVEWVIEYDAKAWWDGTSHFGASLTALENLGRQKGYVLVGCNLGGVNAFFVRSNLAGDRFLAPYTAENHYEPPRYALQQRKTGYPRRP